MSLATPSLNGGQLSRRPVVMRFLSLRFNQQTRHKASDCMSDELKSLVRGIYARDYELFYS